MKSWNNEEIEARKCKSDITVSIGKEQNIPAIAGQLLRIMDGL